MSGTSGWDQQQIDDLTRKGHRDRNAAPVAAPVVVPEISEKELTERCISLLRLKHYRSMVAHNCLTVGVLTFLKGWYIRLNECENNPLMPDLTILPYPNDRPVLMVELKTRKKFQPGQKEMIENGMWKLAWTISEFDAILTRWDATK
jgi:hypothetical protein